jgi:hypothetical protein
MIPLLDRLLAEQAYATHKAMRLRKFATIVGSLRALDEQLIISNLVDEETAKQWRGDTVERLSSVTVCS